MVRIFASESWLHATRTWLRPGLGLQCPSVRQAFPQEGHTQAFQSSVLPSIHSHTYTSCLYGDDGGAGLNGTPHLRTEITSYNSVGMNKHQHSTRSLLTRSHSHQGNLSTGESTWTDWYRKFSYSLQPTLRSVGQLSDSWNRMWLVQLLEGVFLLHTVRGVINRCTKYFHCVINDDILLANLNHIFLRRSECCSLPLNCSTRVCEESSYGSRFPIPTNGICQEKLAIGESIPRGYLQLFLFIALTSAHVCSWLVLEWLALGPSLH